MIVRRALLAGVPAAGLCPGPRIRIELYRRLARLRWLDRLADFRQEMRDRFGPCPNPAETCYWKPRSGSWRATGKSIGSTSRAIHRLRYSDTARIEALARRHPGKVRIVDAKRAYVPLGEDPLKPPEIAEIGQSLLKSKVEEPNIRPFEEMRIPSPPQLNVYAYLCPSLFYPWLNSLLGLLLLSSPPPRPRKSSCRR